MAGKELILLSKLQLPKLNPRILYRARLVNIIAQNIDKKLIILCAGAGYGKTTLLSQYFAETNMAYVYYHLEKEDNDPARFLSHLIAGFQKINSNFGENLKRLTQFYNLPGPISEIVLGTFINEVVKNIKENTFVVLDNYHTLNPSSSIDSIISYFLNHLPENLHFIISTRYSPSISTVHLKAKGEILEINTDMFRFTKEEIRALLTALFSSKLDERQLDWLFKYSEGWPACIRLILQSYEIMQDLNPDSFFNKLQDDYKKIEKNIFDYFAREIFENESSEIQQLLVDWSLLDYLNSEICDTISNRNDCDEILESLSKHNAFIYSLPDGNYRIHHLFQEFLRNRLTDEKKKRQIYQHLAEYWNNYNKDEALKNYILAQDFDSATKTLELTAHNMLAQGKYQIFCSSIEQLPEHLIKKSPLLLRYYGEALNFLGNPVKAKEILTNALNKSRRITDLKAQILYIFAGISINEGNLNQAIKYLKKILKICSEDSTLIKASALNSLGAINNAIAGKSLRWAKHYFKEAYKIAEKNNYQELKTSILNNWGMNEYKQGNLKDAYSKISAAIQLIKKHFSLGCGAGFYNGARIALLLGDSNSAEITLNIGLEVCKPFNDPWSQANIWRGYCLLYQKKNDLEKAREYINRALEVYEKLKIPHLTINALTELCRIEITENNLFETQKILNSIWELKKTEDSETIPILNLQGQLAIKQDNFKEGEKFFLKAFRLAQRYNLVLELFFINFALSDIFYKTNRFNSAKKCLKLAISIAKKKGYDYLLIEELKNKSSLIKFMIDKHIDDKYLFSLLRKNRGFHIIQVFFFGEPKLYIDGREVKDIEWKTIKAKKLFFYLLFNKEKVLNKDILIEYFWKKSGLKQGYDSLRKAVYHIRQTLKNYYIDDPFVIHSGNYQCSSDLYVISDIDEFGQLIKELKTEQNKGIKFKRVLNIYKNGFARNWYDNWAIELADRYRQMFESIMESK